MPPHTTVVDAPGGASSDSNREWTRAMHPAIDILGRHVTLVAKAIPDGQAYRAVETTGEEVILQPVLPGRPLPEPEEEVECVSGAGRWTGIVRSVELPDRVALAIPEWVRRHMQRGAVRIPYAHPIEVRSPLGTAGARLEDLSVTGGAIVLETDLCPPEDSLLWCRLPGGEGTATVRNLREHAHPLLTTIGVSWADIGADTRKWIAAQVSRARTQVTPR